MTYKKLQETKKVFAYLKYINSHTPMTWVCSKGHKWSVDANSIKNNNTWCPTCARKNITIKDMQILAMEKNGRCLSKKYFDQFYKLKWKCEKGHTWYAKPKNVKRGNWCKRCAMSKK